MNSLNGDIQKRIEETKKRVSDLHAELPRWGLVVWTAGNISERVLVSGAPSEEDLFVIKPSGVRYEELSPEKMVVCNLDGDLVEGEYKPSSDTAAHAYVYRHMPEIGGVVHTHSTYACAWAARGEEIPCGLTMIGDEYGGPIPVGPFAIIGDDSIGKGIVETLRNSRSTAVLMKNHGPFTIGTNATKAVKSAVMVEEVAKAMHLAKELGQISPIPQEAIDQLYDRYQNVYGQ
ncbi:L-ribulose-5-phosphate 4-epimerase [Corynebacterium poyangense]|uniref:L-ribulose-5-phosphate 4-epimerase n=1 Tax=Corynebacterium poyangense TaxID=2684405 RepID=A0A7H0SQH5_9CORY|nr:L-ribulose-5-phosphate 4-epimerase [Corynebacterium poyangense]QNQ90800.1 L-ribulose-5-phosphate 4-epimerase [Corynebacterium poyangense]